MKLIEYFKNFLDRSVNLNSSRITLLDERTTAITNFLKESDLLKDNFVDIIPQGSYAHKTIIKPVRSTDEFDADVLLELEEFEDWEACDYVEKLYELFRSRAIYREKVGRKTRCVTIDYANDFHIDIVPYLKRHGSNYVTNRRDNSYELTDPEKFTEWLDEKNRVTKHHFVKVIRLLKYLRDYKRTFAIKSIILSTIVGEQVNDVALLENPNCYDDIPTTLYTIMKKLKAYVQQYQIMPTINDPGQTGENFGDRWHQDGWANFRNKMIFYADKVVEAYEESDKEKSLTKWREIFGEDFKKAEAVNEQRSEASNTALVRFDQTEQQITDLGIPVNMNPVYQVRMIGRVTKKTGFREYDLNTQGNKVSTGRYINFRISRCTVPQPYQVYWKTLNRGNEAINHNCVRGQVVSGGETHQEPTSFRGNHYVECFIVKDGICVAKDRQSVIII
ncbi:hypothetical protein SAMN05192574_105266 [Mucilaginibacter gossypiicola]|uniref:Adenylyl/Guanylyl and SMODS C-terminal sensor domain-containing protein n=1 Tax=Mucilaginibacter gossypiicola TaxID=551995 RepID=A0A1H8LVD7_9SPHI|nr:nucleotidyltransferase [Mucilaginibacter gossypiicola]SEO09077.1 hypothetical protein SAMN05192574_105266 [Mucilaginibacter gossypiicola]